MFEAPERIGDLRGDKEDFHDILSLKRRQDGKGPGNNKIIAPPAFLITLHKGIV